MRKAVRKWDLISDGEDNAVAWDDDGEGWVSMRRKTTPEAES